MGDFMGCFVRGKIWAAGLMVTSALPITMGALAGSVYDFHLASASQAGSRSNVARFGLNFTFAIYQFDQERSSPIDPEIRLPQTFDSLEAERGFLQRRFGLEELLAPHVRSVGLEAGDVFRDGVGMGEQTFSVVVRAARISEFFAALDLTANYGSTLLIDVKNLKLENYETVLLKGGKGRFGVRIFQGPQGREKAPAERTLLVSATAVIVPPGQLRNRPHDISHPTDEFGREVNRGPSDIFIPPAVIETYTPRFTSRRAINATVLVEGVITPDGRPINVRVIRSFDSAYDSVAIEAFRQFKFRSATLNAEPIHATLRVDIAFASTPQ